jgi:hypothetical protein
MANTAQTSSNPLLRKGGGNARLVDAVEGAKPSLPVGAFSRPLPGGTSLVIDRGKGGKCSVSHPWKLRKISQSEGTGQFSVQVASINDVTADIDGVSLTENPTISISMTGTEEVYIEITGTMTENEGYVLGGSVSRVEVKTGESLPASDQSDHVYRVRIARVIDGRIEQSAFNNGSAAFANAGNPPDGSAILHLGLGL